MSYKAEQGTEDSRRARVGEILETRFESHKIGYVHPATGRRQELIRDGYTVIASNVSLDAMRKDAKTLPEKTVWLTTGEVFALPAKQKQDAA
jgi:hypothetical protein